MEHCRSGSDAHWCAQADAPFGVPGMHVLEVDEEPPGGGRRPLMLTVGTDADVTGYPGDGVLAVGHGRREHRAADASRSSAPTTVVWRKRIWPCPDPECPTGTFAEVHKLIPPRAELTARPVRWPTDALGPHDTMVSALAATSAWGAHPPERRRGGSDHPHRPTRAAYRRAHLGVEEHIWRPSKCGTDRAATAMADLIPRRARPAARPPARRRGGPLGHGLRRLADLA